MKGTAFFRAPLVTYGPGCAQAIGEHASRLGKKALLVTDVRLEELGILDSIKDSLSGAGVAFSVYNGVTQEPVLDFVHQGLDMFRYEGCDMLISVGGGSCIDTAKGISILATNKGDLPDVEGINKVDSPGAPHLAVPTTAGTGSEATATTIVTDTKRNVKMLIISPHIIPRVAVVDPLLTIEMPQSITASTGLDALTHAIEAYVSVKANPIADALALHAIELIYDNLPMAWADGHNIEARTNMMVAALEAGLAFSNSSVALVHGMARPLGAYFHIPHGLANAALLATVVKFSLIGNPKRYAEIARAMGQDTGGMDPLEAAGLCAKAVKRLVGALKIPPLSGLGVEKERFEEVVEKMASDALASGSPVNNPRKATQEEIVQLYREAF
jgi:alcohol dehydrogenase class IV